MSAKAKSVPLVVCAYPDCRVVLPGPYGTPGVSMSRRGGDSILICSACGVREALAPEVMERLPGKFKTIAEQERERNLAAQAEAEGLLVFRTRTPGNDGWAFVAAPSRPAAARAFGVPMEKVTRADRHQVETIACRALRGV